MPPEGSVPPSHGAAEDEVLRHGGAERDGSAAAGGHAVAAAAGAKGLQRRFPAEKLQQACLRSDAHRRLSRQVAEGVERGGPVYSLTAKLSEIQAGLSSVQKRLDERSPTVTQAKVTQKVSEGGKDHRGLKASVGITNVTLTTCLMY